MLMTKWDLFQTRQGLPQGDPLYQYWLAFLLICNRSKTEGQIIGVVPHLVEGGLSILQYAKDIILFIEHDQEKAQNIKVPLSNYRN